MIQRTPFQGVNPDDGMSQQEIMDMEMGTVTRKPFTREDFRYMVNKTYAEYYGKFKDQFNPDEYM